MVPNSHLDFCKHLIYLQIWGTEKKKATQFNSCIALELTDI